MTGGAGPSSVSTGIWVPVRAVFRGIGQIFFQENALTGACFALGIALNSPLMGAGAVIGSAIGAATARTLGFDRTETAAGIYGFNSSLVGIAAFFFFRPGAMPAALLVGGSIAAALVTRVMRRFVPFPTYTTPFIVTTWAVDILGLALALPRVGVPKLPEATDFLQAVAEGVSEVMLQANVLTGLLFLVGIALNDWRHASWALLASLLGTTEALYHHDPAGGIAIGLYGYNATLTAIALSLWRRSLIAPLLGILLSVPITEYFPLLGLPTLTAPFVLATWLVLACDRLEAILYGPRAPASA
jgi:urea transporter